MNSGKGFLRVFVPAIFLGMSFAGCSDGGAVSRREIVMGSVSEITLRGVPRARLETVFEEAFGVLREIEAKLSIFNPTSEISGINREGASGPVPVSKETYGLLERAGALCLETRGAFDVTVLGLMRAWGFYSAGRRVPPAERIRESLAGTGCGKILMDPERQTVRLERGTAGIDLGGIAKGYACDRAAAFLKSRGVEHALVNVGGTVFAFGSPAPGKPWKVGIRHPREASSIFKIVTLDGEAVSTSGDYEQFFMEGGERYSHIMDPRTGYPVRETAAVSVIAPSAELADVLATALFVSGPKEARALAEKFEAVRWYLFFGGDGDGALKMISGDSADPLEIP